MILKSHTIWNEKYRPTSLETYVGNDTIKKTFDNYIKSNDVPHLLLHGHPDRDWETYLEYFLMY